MKIQENYFYKLDNLKEVKVIWKKYDKVNILEIGIKYPTAIVDLDRFSGIPITEEWLLNFGFKKGVRGWFKTYGRNQKFNLYMYRSLFNYVHHLQNIYFALTGEELVLSNAVS